jgi:hypothetical protein
MKKNDQGCKTSDNAGHQSMTATCTLHFFPPLSECSPAFAVRFLDSIGQTIAVS